MMTRSSFLFLALATASVLVAAKPNFGGEWKLDAAKSDFGDMPAPGNLVYQIDHADPKISAKMFQSGGPLGELSSDLTYMTDGSETKNKVRGSDVASTGKWAGDTLKIATKMALQGSELTINEIWKLTGGGKTLEITREMTSAQGSSTMKLVFTKSDKK
jgi:hypothetical protein